MSCHQLKLAAVGNVWGSGVGEPVGPSGGRKQRTFEQLCRKTRHCTDQNELKDKHQRSVVIAVAASACVWLFLGQLSFVNSPVANREVNVAAAAAVQYETDMPAENGVYPVGNAKRTAPYGERDPLPEGYGIRTGLSDLLKPLNAEAGVVAKEDSIPTVLATCLAITIHCISEVLFKLPVTCCAMFFKVGKTGDGDWHCHAFPVLLAAVAPRQPVGSAAAGG